jgi:colicin import membrane protein
MCFTIINKQTAMGNTNATDTDTMMTNRPHQLRMENKIEAGAITERLEQEKMFREKEVAQPARKEALLRDGRDDLTEAEAELTQREDERYAKRVRQTERTVKMAAARDIRAENAEREKAMKEKEAKALVARRAEQARRIEQAELALQTDRIYYAEAKAREEKATTARAEQVAEQVAAIRANHPEWAEQAAKGRAERRAEQEKARLAKAAEGRAKGLAAKRARQQTEQQPAKRTEFLFSVV